MDQVEPIHGASVMAIDETIAGDIDALSEAFLWSKSPQGHDHWAAIWLTDKPLDPKSTAYLIRLRDAVLAREKGE